MKKLLLAALSLAVLLVTVTANAEPRGARFYFKPGSPQAFAEPVQMAISADPTGMTIIDLVKCETAGNRSCASPHDILVGILATDPRASVNGVPLTSVTQLPDFLRKLSAQRAPKGATWMWCMVKSTTSASGWTPFRHCVKRSFHDGELIYVDRDTNIGLFAGECTNLVEVTLPPPQCAYIDYPSDEGDLDLRFEEVGSIDITDDACTALLRAGESDWESPFVERCPDINCNFAAANQVLGLEQRNTGSHAFVPGMNTISVPMICAEDDTKCRMVFCKGLKDGTRSFGMGVSAFDFVVVNGRRVATIYHNKQALQLARATRTNGQPSNLYWHFDGDSDEDKQYQ